MPEVGTPPHHNYIKEYLLVAQNTHELLFEFLQGSLYI